MALINEAPYRIRRRFVLLLALWFGNKKPPRKALLDHPLFDLRRLQEDGIVVNGRQYFVRVLIVTTDTVARTIPWNMTQFNGKCGCNFCLMIGRRVKKGNGTVQVYPEPSDGTIVEQRTLEQHMRDMAEVIRTKKTINGIRGETPFVGLPGFDFIKACVPEYMHAVCLGVIKALLNLWFKGKRTKGDWFIGSKRNIQIINGRLNNLKPPSEVTRTPGAIDDLKNWKASMFRSFALYYFVLEDLLPKKYFDHFKSLSYGLNVLLQERVHVQRVENVRPLFLQFVKDA